MGERARGSLDEGVCIAFVLHQFGVTRFEDAGLDTLMGFALTSPSAHTRRRLFCSATWLTSHSHLAPVDTFVVVSVFQSDTEGEKKYWRQAYARTRKRKKYLLIPQQRGR